MAGTYRQSAGQTGEERAAAFLAENGFSLIDRNVRCGRIGEIDIVASKGSLVIFVEVKTRTGGAYGGAMYSVSGNKMKTMRKAAQWFINGNRPALPAEPVFRFDLIAIDKNELEWIQDIIR